jgi:chorismate dehydratase
VVEGLRAYEHAGIFLPAAEARIIKSQRELGITATPPHSEGNGMNDQEPIRIGAVNYLNTKPLVYGLEQLAPAANVVYQLPSRLADALATGSLDVALIPSIELLGNARYKVVSDACIGCQGPVLSVKLFSRTPIDQICSLALDEGSRTSIALIQILLDQQYNLQPELKLLPIGASLEDVSSDAVLLIGDRAIHSPAGSFQAVWDLGDQWQRWTGLPFVFALWAARVETPLPGIEQALASARDAGEAHLAEIAEAEAPALGLTQPQCLDYLCNNLNFHLGPQQQQGLQLFHELSEKLGLAPAGESLTTSTWDAS